ncbi:hypothetical protein PYCCODRAFT_462966 [Trametes coccinea BRFM310]|uniref:Uncharacterized protein n=1 Tax=Trametes coccinea (strain BRFM310) TaxID=1353009 RepID=A0A1Y2ILG9_TRAC3|nr:hypothetical protein PYCCODRAFT_462966 [Trametes coccinea BRFM310]
MLHHSGPIQLKSCTTEFILGQILEPLQYLPWAVFSALRTWALCRQRSWAMLVFLASLSPVIITAVSFRWLEVLLYCLSSLQITETEISTRDAPWRGSCLRMELSISRAFT